jgi:hypothetical protein
LKSLNTAQVEWVTGAERGSNSQPALQRSLLRLTARIAISVRRRKTVIPFYAE